MLDNEELLFDELYEKTKDCGRVQFVELLMTKERENKELKLQLKGTTHCFDEEDHEKLKKQVEEYKDKINWYENFEINKTIDKLRIKHNNQQKEFIGWLEAMSKMYENEYKDIDIAGHYNCVLAKYKEIIGDDK